MTAILLASAAFVLGLGLGISLVCYVEARAFVRCGLHRSDTLRLLARLAKRESARRGA